MNIEALKYFKNNDLALSVWEDKYFKKGDITPDDMHWRMAMKFAEADFEYLSFEKEIYLSELSVFGQKLHLQYDYLSENQLAQRYYELFKDFKYIVPQGSIMSQLGADSIGSLSNCFVIGQPSDSYGGIFQKDEEMAQLEKRRGGVGIDISTLRPKNTPTTNAAKYSTGAVSFMHRFSNTTREVAQNGRRGALMISIDINHPDVMDFIKIKRDLTQVTGANISIKLNDEFMKAVENDEDYILRFPCDLNCSIKTEYFKNLPYNKLVENKPDNTTSYYKKIKAKEYWEELNKSAHGVAEPGLMFWDNMVNYSPDGIYPQFRQVTTNPCSEIGMQPYDACRLIAVNLFSFVSNPFTKNAKFDFEKFYQVNYEAMRLSDNLIDLELKQIDRIIDKIESDTEDDEIKYTELNLWKKIKNVASASRRTGLGFTSLGDTLAALGLKYDSDKSLEIIEQIMKVKLESELDCTIDLAIIRGTFEGWNHTMEYEEFISDDGNYPVGKNDFYEFIGREFTEQLERMEKWGRRNVSWSTVAPTGTVNKLAA